MIPNDNDRHESLSQNGFFGEVLHGIGHCSFNRVLDNT